MAWDLFRWGGRGLWYTTGVEGIYMAHVLIAGACRVVLQVRDNQGDVLMNTFHVKVPIAPVTHEHCVAIAGQVAGWWDSDYRHMCNDQITGFQVVVTGADAVPAFQFAQGLTTAGDRIGSGLTTSVTLAIKGQTGLAGRRFRGRQYMFPATALDLEPLDPDLFIASYKDAAAGVWNNLVSGLGAGGYLVGVGSYVNAQVYPYTNYIAVDRNVDAQRRRLRGRGN